MSTYYNDNDPKVAAWLSQLVATGQLPQGIIHASPIQEITPSEVAKHTQCHFFAGIGGWPLALRLAGWPDDAPVWTGSCPCQPFSTAGKGRGYADERHLWPVFFKLIAECRPPVVFGEQVASRLGREWLAGVRADLESVGYAVGAADLCAAGVGAPHIRQRLYWVAYANGDGSLDGINSQKGFRPATASERGSTRRLADPDRPRPQGRRSTKLRERADERPFGKNGGVGWVADSDSAGQHERSSGGEQSVCDICSNPGFWSSFDLIPCRDGKFRRVESGTQQMVDGISRAMGRLRDSSTQEKERLAHATQGNRITREIMHAVRIGYDPKEIWQSLGRRYGFHEAALLLACLCQQSGELGRIFIGAASSRTTAHEEPLRIVQTPTQTPACSPQGWELLQQLAGELEHIVSELPQEGASDFAGFTGHPLAKGVPARVVRLRGYGNAIVPQVAATFIKAFLAAVREVAP